MKDAEDTAKWLDALRAVLPVEAVKVDDETRAAHDHDETEDLHFLPQAVVFPTTPEEVAAVVKIAGRYNVPVTPVAAQTGLSGGALPVKGGIALSTQKLNRILDIDVANFQATVEPGVINQVFHEACKEQGMFYPPDPSSWGTSTLGGNVAYNAGGPRL